MVPLLWRREKVAELSFTVKVVLELRRLSERNRDDPGSPNRIWPVVDGWQIRAKDLMESLVEAP